MTSSGSFAVISQRGGERELIFRHMPGPESLLHLLLSPLLGGALNDPCDPIDSSGAISVDAPTQSPATVLFESGLTELSVFDHVTASGDLFRTMRQRQVVVKESPDEIRRRLGGPR